MSEKTVTVKLVLVGKNAKDTLYKFQGVGLTPQVSNLYVDQSAFKGAAPDNITLTITAS